jgi:glyoxylase-like metal-dependent hydrolase (beta-lactamase superfamily II)
MSTPEPYKIYAVNYGFHERRASANFIGGDEHDGPMPITFYVWAVVGNGRTFLVDTGFRKEVALHRHRNITRPVEEGLRKIQLDTKEIKDVILTHMHYDHAGNLDLFPNARLHVQDDEVEFVTGRCMTHAAFRHPIEQEDVLTLIRRNFAGQVEFHNGDEEIAPGLSVHRIGGHTKGLQAARVWTERGWVVLASDASHFYANMQQGRAFPIVYNQHEMLDGHRRLIDLAETPDHVVPGHDPLVQKRYPKAIGGLDDIVRLDLEPAPI